MSDNKGRNLAKLQTDLALQHEESQISVARRKKFLYRRLAAFFVVAAVMAYIMVSTLISQHSTLTDKKAEKERVHQELASLKQEEVLLKEEIVKLNDDDYIAKLARKEYFLSGEDEIIFTLPVEKGKKEKEEEEEEEKSTN